jgi:hypothetical protein
MKQPRIDTAEKQRNANNPRPWYADEDRTTHPGYPPADAEPTGGDLFDIFVAPDADIEGLANQEITITERQVHEMRAEFPDYDPAILALTDLQIARRVRDHAIDLMGWRF